MKFRSIDRFIMIDLAEFMVRDGMVCYEDDDPEDFLVLHVRLREFITERAELSPLSELSPLLQSFVARALAIIQEIKDIDPNWVRDTREVREVKSPKDSQTPRRHKRSFCRV